MRVHHRRRGIDGREERLAQGTVEIATQLVLVIKGRRQPDGHPPQGILGRVQHLRPKVQQPTDLPATHQPRYVDESRAGVVTDPRAGRVVGIGDDPQLVSL